MDTVILFLAALVSLVLLFAQVKMFSVDATLKEILEELRRMRRAMEEQSAALPTRTDAAESRNEDIVKDSLNAPQVTPDHQAILAPWQRGR